MEWWSLGVMARPERSLTPFEMTAFVALSFRPQGEILLQDSFEK